MQIKHSHTSFIPSQQPVTRTIKHEQRHEIHMNWNIKYEPVKALSTEINWWRVKRQKEQKKKNTITTSKLLCNLNQNDNLINYPSIKFE